MPLRKSEGRNDFPGLRFAAPCGTLFCILTSAFLLAPGSFFAQQPQNQEKKVKNRSLHWNPPKLDPPIKGVSVSPPCDLAEVLQRAAASTSELITNLQNFTAQEKIAYQVSDREGFALDAGSGSFDYVVIFERAEGKPLVEESRKPMRGSIMFPAAAQSRGLPEMVLMFLPNLQGDYEMKCEGTTDWGGQRAWVVHFQQRPDKPSRTFSFSGLGAVYSASLKGHAWIAADSGQVVHLETGLMQGVPETRVRQWLLSINYAPVQFRTRDVRIWLPEIADSYYDFGDYREIVYHTFTNFMLFSTQVNQKIENPKIP